MLLRNKINTKNKYCLHNDVVLEMNIFIILKVLSRIMKGREKQAMTSFQLIQPITQNSTNRKGIYDKITVIL